MTAIQPPFLTKTLSKLQKLTSIRGFPYCFAPIPRTACWSQYSTFPHHVSAVTHAYGTSPNGYMNPLSGEMDLNVDNEGTVHHLLFKLGGFFKAGHTEKVLANPSEASEAALNGVADRLTHLAFDHWSQAAVRIRLKLDGEKKKIVLYIEDPTKPPYEKLAQRGKGLQQFLYIWLLLQYKLDELHRRLNSEELKDRTILLLIDEDLLNISTYLHPPAQRDLMRFLSAFARENVLQIVLATHSPFLVDWNRPDRVRALFRNWKQSNKGVTVLSKLHPLLHRQHRPAQRERRSPY